MKTPARPFCVASLMLLASSAGLIASDVGAEKLLFKMIDSNPNAVSMPLSDVPAGSYFFQDDDVRKSGFDPAQLKRGWYRNIYDGIDLVCYGDNSHVEYVFVVSPGADLARIRILSDGQKDTELDAASNVAYKMRSATVNQTKPVVYMKVENSKRRVEGFYTLGEDNIISIVPGDVFKKQVSNLEYLEFLNCAQTNSSNPIGMNMHFDRGGNVWISTTMREEEKVFDVDSSRLAYDSGELPGRRYYFKDATGGGRKSFADKPVAGVSWIGAMKYCNWRTIMSGAGAANRCYTEGSNTMDWTPAPDNPWPKNIFQAVTSESGKGFQIEMPYLPTETFMIHFLCSFYYDEAEDSAEHDLEDVLESDKERTYAEEQAPAAEPGVAVDVNAPSRKGDITTPGGLTYKTQPGTETTGGEQGEDDGDEDVTPDEDTEGDVKDDGSVLPGLPPEDQPGGGPSGPTRVTIDIESANPPSGIGISVSQDVNGTTGNTTAFSVTYIIGTNVTLTAPWIGTATPGAVTVFDEWRSSGNSSLNTTNVSITFAATSDDTMTAVYRDAPTLYVNSVSPDSGVMVTVTATDKITDSGSAGGTSYFCDYYPNATVRLDAPATAGGNPFDHWVWTVNGVTNSAVGLSLTIQMTSDTIVTAYYRQPVLTVMSSSPNSGVNIGVFPNNNDGTTNGITTFAVNYGFNVMATVTAPQTAPNSYVFQGWEYNGSIAETNLTYSIQMNADRTVVAVYEYVPGDIPDPPTSPSGL